MCSLARYRLAALAGIPPNPPIPPFLDGSPAPPSFADGPRSRRNDTGDVGVVLNRLHFQFDPSKDTILEGRKRSS